MCQWRNNHKYTQATKNIFQKKNSITEYKKHVLDNYTYPPGTTLAASIYSMGRDPKLFPEPMKFLPERFDVMEKENMADGARVNNFAYVPFSAGQRNCIGQKFAMLEMKSILSKLMQDFEFHLDDNSKDEPRLVAELVLKPADPIIFYINARNFNK